MIDLKQIEKRALIISEYEKVLAEGGGTEAFDSKGRKGKWVTIKSGPLFIAEGSSVGDALKEKIGYKVGKLAGMGKDYAKEKIKEFTKDKVKQKTGKDIDVPDSLLDKAEEAIGKMGKKWINV